MRLALHTDYALRVLIYLAMQRRRSRIGEIADFFGISKDHLAKVAHRLSQEQWVRSIRGVGGGLELARSPDDIRIGDVIARFEGGMHFLDCVVVEDVCVIQPGCRLRNVLMEAERLQREYLNSVTLADVVAADSDLVQLTVSPGETA
jgi:Rrf2 family transcriptional regulator, nitric oxide-sensitive transcriptional repressor